MKLLLKEEFNVLPPKGRFWETMFLIPVSGASPLRDSKSVGRPICIEASLLSASFLGV